jgi:hypothetical protein
MQYKKQRKTNWWVIFLFIPLLVGCSPVTQQLFNVGVYVGGVLVETVIGKTIEAIFDKVISYILPHVKPDPDNSSRGRYTGELIFKKEDPNCRDVHIEKQPQMVRESIKKEWQSAPEVKDRINHFYERHC